jgi:hypothetical protein
MLCKLSVVDPEELSHPHQARTRRTRLVSMLRPFVVFTTLGLALPVCGGTRALEQEDIAGVVARSFPRAAIVQRAEVDQIACAPIGERPGVVSADLNGDGLQDFGTLLRLNFTGKEGVWQGKPYKEAQFAFVVFVNQGGGRFRTHVAKRYTSDIPTAVSLDVHEPGIIRDRETGKNIQLLRRGITMSFCEKSAAIYYVDGNRVRSIQLAD